MLSSKNKFVYLLENLTSVYEQIIALTLCI